MALTTPATSAQARWGKGIKNPLAQTNLSKGKSILVVQYLALGQAPNNYLYIAAAALL